MSRAEDADRTSSEWNDCVPEPNTGCWIADDATSPSAQRRRSGDRAGGGQKLRRCCSMELCVNPAHHVVEK